MPVFLISILLFVAWLTFQLRKSSKPGKESSDEFWARERDSNFARPPVDISSIEYLTVPLEDLPFREDAGDELIEVQNTLKELSQKKLLNLTGLSNTDIKYKYGAKHYEHFAACDQNFTLLARALNNWGHLLYEEGRHEDAKTVLEYAISCKTDVSKSFSLLGKIYYEEKRPDKIRDLMASADEINSLMKKSILDNLQSYLD